MAFEPLPDLADELRQRFPAVDVRTTALADVTGTGEFIRYRSRPALSGLRARQDVHAPTQTLEVSLARLDDVIPEGYAPRLIKIDVEGAELQVLQGGLATLLEHRPFVVFEHAKSGAPHYGTSPRDLYGLLVDQAGYRLFDLYGDGPLDGARFNDLFERAARWNFVAAP